MSTPAESSTSNPTTPGRPEVHQPQIYSDPRVQLVLLQQLSEIGLDRIREPKSLATLPLQPSNIDLAVLMAEIEMGFESLYEALPNELVSDQFEIETAREDRVINGGNKVHIYRPGLSTAPLPCVVYFHGGGMSTLSTVNKVHDRWARSLAAAGVVVVMVDFRNAYTAAAYLPYPAGLSDCASAVHWLYYNREALNIGNIVLQGEGGGANLAMATALKANREAWAYKIDGVYAIAPFISNAYSWPLSAKQSHLPSLVECHGYLLSVSVLRHMASFYTPNPQDQTQPLAWPYYASLADMSGLCPHTIVVDELDPLRDEGIAYGRKLAKAGVDVLTRMNIGTVHAASVMFRKALPNLHRSTISDIAAFARRV